MSTENNGSAVYNILAFNFAGQKTASGILKEIKASGALEGITSWHRPWSSRTRKARPMYTSRATAALALS